jgi:rhodanese-related sulfurtransferase
MTVQRIAVKLFVAGASSAPIDLHPFIGIFHRIIQRGALPGLLIDVADYAHVPEGPGVVLIGHEVDYGMDLAGGRTGLLVVRKRLKDVSLAEALRDTLVRALAAVTVLEAEPEAKLRFATNGFHLDVLDRLAAENSDAGFAKVQQEIAPLLAALYGKDVRVTRASASDPRKPLGLHVEAQGAPGADELAKRIASLGTAQPSRAAAAQAAKAAQQSPWDISVEELDRLRKQKANFVLLDVREPHEFEICNLGGKLIPLKTVPARLAELDKNAHIVVHCRTGGRSAQAVQVLRGAGFENAWNVQGGILAWIDRIDPSLTRY